MMVGAESASSMQSEQRTDLFSEQFDLALAFYALDDGTQSRERHRAIVQEMADRAVELALPHLAHVVEEQHVSRAVLVAPLRGGLGLVTPRTLGRLRGALSGFGPSDVLVEPWAVGVKRHPAQDRAEVYFSCGLQRADNHDAAAIILDFGTATGLTTVAVARELKQAGIDYRRMTSISMTLAEKGRKRILESCIDSDGRRIQIEAATRANLNDKDYVYQIAPTFSAAFCDVNPKDWGERMWGMENTHGSPDVLHHEVNEFMYHFFQTFEGVTDYSQRVALKDYYLRQYAPLG